MGAGPGEGGREPLPGRWTEGSVLSITQQWHWSSCPASLGLSFHIYKTGSPASEAKFVSAFSWVSHVHPESLQLTPHMAARPPASPRLPALSLFPLRAPLNSPEHRASVCRALWGGLPGVSTELSVQTPEGEGQLRPSPLTTLLFLFALSA